MCLASQGDIPFYVTFTGTLKVLLHSTVHHALRGGNLMTKTMLSSCSYASCSFWGLLIEGSRRCTAHKLLLIVANDENDAFELRL